eukprot:COSAG02_NODE_1910_length_10418_cov_44.653552_6_plen_56_part_00
MNESPRWSSSRVRCPRVPCYTTAAAAIQRGTDNMSFGVVMEAVEARWTVLDRPGK